MADDIYWYPFPEGFEEDFEPTGVRQGALRYEACTPERVATHESNRYGTLEVRSYRASDRSLASVVYVPAHQTFVVPKTRSMVKILGELVRRPGEREVGAVDYTPVEDL